MDQNNHEIFESLRDISDGTGADGVKNPDLRAKADATYVNPKQAKGKDPISIKVDQMRRQDNMNEAYDDNQKKKHRSLV